MSDWIKIHRSIEEWEWIDDPTMVYFWVRILLMANLEERKWHEVTIGRGSFVTSISMLSAELGLTPKQVRTCLDRLMKGKRIGKQRAGVRANEKTIVTIYEFDSYAGVSDNIGQTKGTRNGKRNGTQTAQIEKVPLIPPYGSLSDYPSLSPLISPQEERKKDGVSTDTPKKKDEPFSAPSDYELVMVLWNSSAKRSIPKVKAMSPARKEKVKLRVKEMGGWAKAKETLAECFQKIGESDFCNGATGKWVATFDWFFDNEKNWMKVLEGNYDNRQEKSQLEVLADNIKKADEYYASRYGHASPYGNQAGGREDGPDEQ